MSNTPSVTSDNYSQMLKKRDALERDKDNAYNLALAYQEKFNQLDDAIGKYEEERALDD